MSSSKKRCFSPHPGPRTPKKMSIPDPIFEEKRNMYSRRGAVDSSFDDSLKQAAQKLVGTHDQMTKEEAVYEPDHEDENNIFDLINKHKNV